MITDGFEETRDEWVAELNCRARIFRHVKTGAQLLSVENDDENKVFGIAFRTPPTDSTGIAHILEHSVLGGSHKYPLKEPFVQLIKGSLKTFLNAFTSPDKTTYPVASQNLQDFYNLVDVYLDAVFHPLITPGHLQQEGWHYELDHIDGPLSYKGVVYNEMKGVYSSPDSMLYRHSQQVLFPDNTYSLDSGGDPAVIPELTYDQFVDFHAAYYHPSNARIFFYGDDDPAQRLKLLDAYLCDYEAQPTDGMVALQEPFSAPRQVTKAYPTDEEGDANWMVQLNWLLPESHEPDLRMALSVLSHALVSSHASPLRKALVDSSLGEDVTGGGLGTGLRQPTFRIGLKGVAKADVDRVEPLVMETLKQLAATGIEAEMVAASLNTIEFSLRENNTGSYPRGLSLMLRSLNTWLYDQDPLALLAYEAPLAHFRERLAADKDFLPGLIRTYLLDNMHRVTLILEPDPAFTQSWEAEEQARLDAAYSAMSLAEREAVIDNALTLKRQQERPDPPELLATLPSLTLSDLPLENKSIPRQVTSSNDAQIIYHDLFTNGIVYLDVGFDMRTVPQELLPFVRLFGQALIEIGTADQDYVRLAQRIGRSTGGIYPSTFISSVRDDANGTAWSLLHGKATIDQASEMLNIMRDILLTVRLDNRERLRQMILKSKARLEGALVPSGHGFVSRRLSSSFSTAGWVNEQQTGIDYLFFIRELADRIDQDWDGVLTALESVRTALITRNGAFCNVTLDAANWQKFEPQLEAFLADLPASSPQTVAWQPTWNRADEGLIIPAQVNYVGKAANLYELGYEYHGSINVITNYVRTSWLWDKVRAQGGAYGAFIRFAKQSGVISFLSYRDPNLLNTLDVYDETAKFLHDQELSSDEYPLASGNW